MQNLTEELQVRHRIQCSRDRAENVHQLANMTMTQVLSSWLQQIVVCEKDFDISWQSQKMFLGNAVAEQSRSLIYREHQPLQASSRRTSWRTWPLPSMGMLTDCHQSQWRQRAGTNLAKRPRGEKQVLARLRHVSTQYRIASRVMNLEKRYGGKRATATSEFHRVGM